MWEMHSGNGLRYTQNLKLFSDVLIIQNLLTLILEFPHFNVSAASFHLSQPFPLFLALYSSSSLLALPVVVVLIVPRALRATAAISYT